jgi:hypothetical protein
MNDDFVTAVEACVDRIRAGSEHRKTNHDRHFEHRYLTARRDEVRDQQRRGDHAMDDGREETHRNQHSSANENRRVEEDQRTRQVQVRHRGDAVEAVNDELGPDRQPKEQEAGAWQMRGETRKETLQRGYATRDLCDRNRVFREGGSTTFG